MNHAIEVHLAANVDKYKAGMDAAKKMGSESLGFIATIFDKIKTMFSGLWDSFKSFFSGGTDKFKSAFGSMSDSASGAFQKISGYFSGFDSDLDKSKAKMGETEQQSSSLAKEIGVGLVAAFVALSAVVGALTAKGLAVDAMFAGIAISSGIAVSQISRFEGAAARSGVGVKDLGASMSKFREAMAKAAAGDGSDVFSKMGVKVADSNNALLKTDDVLIDVSKKIAGMSTETEKYAAAAKLGFDGKVQVLEDIAHASDLSARVTDDQAAAVKRLGAIWHEILPAGQSMWSTISDKLTNALTPAMTTASVTILESKNRIVEAFGQIYGGGSLLDKLGDKIRDWSKSASSWFDGVGKSATDMTVSLMKYVAAKTGLGKPDALKPTGTGYVPGTTKLTSETADPVTTEAEKAARQQFDQTTKSIAERIAIMKEQIKNGAVLTEGQRALLQLDSASLKQSPEKLAAAKAQATALDELEKQFKAQQDAQAASAAAGKKEQEQYASLIASIQSKIDSDKIELAVGAEATESQKMLAKLNAEVASGKLKLSDAHLVAARAAIQELGVVEQQIKSGKQYSEMIKAMHDAGVATISGLDEQIAKQREHNAEIGKTKEQIELAKKAQMDADTAQVQSDANYLRDGLAKWDLDEKARAAFQIRLSDLDAEIARRKALSAEIARGADLEAGAAAAQSLKDFLDPTKAQTFGESLRTAFGTAGDSLTKLTGALQQYGIQQAEIEKQRGNAALEYLTGVKTESEYLKDVDALSQRSTKNQLAGYGNMASAAAGFFGEHSRGYQSLMAVSQVFHAAELAMTTAELVPKAISAVLSQGQGDPYTAFGRMAAMAALVAGLGVAIGGAGGSGPSVSQQRQQSQGTGTVLGDGNAKSDSIANALKLTAANSSTQINYLASMNTALQTIQANIKSFASQLLRTTDVTNPNVGALNSNNGFGTTLVTGAAIGVGGMAAAGLSAFTSLASIAGPAGLLLGALASKIPVISNLLGKIGTSVFGGKQSVEDSGITMDKTSLAAIMSKGVNAKTFADIKTSGGWFHGDKHDTKTASVGDEANRQFATIITSMADAVKQAGVLLGMNGDTFSAKLNTFVIDIGKVSLKDLKGDDLQKALEAVFSKLGDQMASFGVAGLQQFQQVGEGYLETLVRVASDYAKVDASLQSIGKTFGAVGVQSIAARENLISLLGGIDDFQSKTADYAKNFLTTAQQLAPVQKYVTDSLAQMGLGWVTTRQQFAGVVAGLNLTTTAGQQTYAALMNLEQAFAATHEAIVDTTKSAQDIADERKDLQSQYDQLTLTSAQLLAKQRAALDDSNKALFDQVQAAQKVKDAQDAAKASLGSLVTQLKSFGATAAGLNNSLSLGSLSTLTPEQQYAEARRQFELTRQQAAAGDTTAQGNLQAIEQTFLTLSQKLNAGDSQYSSDLAAVMHANDDLAKWAAQQVDVAQASLDALNDSSATLADISATLKVIAQGGQFLPATSGEGAVSAAAAPIDYSTMGTSNMTPLVDEIKSLRGQVADLLAEAKGRRADAQQQTGDVIKTLATSTDKAADKVVAGNSQSDADIEWRLKAAVRKIV